MQEQTETEQKQFQIYEPSFRMYTKRIYVERLKLYSNCSFIKYVALSRIKAEMDLNYN